MKNKLNPEERLFRDKLNSNEFSYEESHWVEMEKMLPKKGFWGNYSSSLKALIGITLLSATVFLLNREETFISKNHSSAKETMHAQESTLTENKTPIITSENNEQDDQKNTDLLVTNENQLAASETKEELLPNNKVSKIETKTRSDQEIKAAITEVSKSKNAEKKATAFSPQLNGLKAPKEVCLGEILVAELIPSSEENYSYRWFINNVLYHESNASLKYLVKEAGQLLIRGELIYQNHVVDYLQKEVVIHEPASIDFSFTDPKEPYDDLKVELTASGNLLSYEWNIDGISKEGAFVEHAFAKEGEYPITLSGKNSNGCISRVNKKISIREDFDPLAPNALVINGEPKNREFMPQAFTIRQDQFLMEIFSQNGDLIYKTNSVFEPWDGSTNNSGAAIIKGNYVWKVTISNKEGAIKSYNGIIKVTDFKR